MATALFINRTDLVRNTIINGDVDTDKFIQFIRISQQMHIQNYLGTALYDEISTAITANTLTTDQTALLNDYIQPMLIHFSMVDYLPFSSVELRNGGLFKHTAENGTSPTTNEVDFLVQKHRNFAEFYTRRFIDYMAFNAASKFPKYWENQNNQMYPDMSATFTGWVL
jgi:hypothetical protein